MFDFDDVILCIQQGACGVSGMVSFFLELRSQEYRARKPLGTHSKALCAFGVWRNFF